MSFRAPRRICFDGNEGMIRPGLYPPGPAVRINNNLLLWSSVSYSSRDCVDSFAATLGCRRNFGEGDGWCFLEFFWPARHQGHHAKENDSYSQGRTHAEAPSM